MANKKHVLVGSLAVVVATGAIGVGVTNASFDGNVARREAVQRAFESRDIKGFQEAKKDFTRLDDIDTKKEFEAIALAHDLRRDKKYKEAREVLQNAGIERSGTGVKRGPRADVRDAIVNGDWKEFQHLTKEKHIGHIINTSEKFEQFAEAHELRKEKRYSEAHIIMKELGLGRRDK